LNNKVKILYFGNDLTLTKGYYSTMQLLFESLDGEENIEILKSSSKSNIALRMVDMLLFFFKNKNADLIIIDTFSTTAFYYALVISQLARIFSIPFIPILHGGNLPIRIDNSRRWSKLIFRNAKINIAPSNYLKEIFVDHGFRTQLIPNIIDFDNYKFTSSLIKDHPRLLYVRAFAQIYNPLMALEVLKKIKIKYPKASLTMVGPDRDGTQIDFERKMIDMKLQDSVKITGVMKKYDWHKLAESHNIFINTTNIDNTPVSVIEAMALGLPIVSTNVGGLPFIISHNINGILVNPNESEFMAEMIISIFQNDSFSNELRLEAKKKINDFRWSSVRESWIRVIFND